jgi:hypothetical protein
VNANRTTEEGELQDILDRLDNPQAVTIGKIRTSNEDPELDEWFKDRKNRKAINHKLEACGYGAVNNTDATDGLWRIDDRRQVVYAKATLSLKEQFKAAQTLQREAEKAKKAAEVKKAAEAKKAEAERKRKGKKKIRF